MAMPDYKNSIVNLISSIKEAYGIKSKYPALKQLSKKELEKNRNIVLLIVDGLGYDFVLKKGGFLKENLTSKITSVFPSTTAACITTFYTGVAPQQHSITGWFMKLKETGSICAILPYKTRCSQDILVNPDKIFQARPFTGKIKAEPSIVMYKPIINSTYNAFNAKGMKTFPYTNLNSFFNQVKKAVLSSKKKKYIHAYWPGFDSICHQYGKKSHFAKKHFFEIEKGIKRLLKSLKGTKTLLIITADHGMIDVDKKKHLDIKRYPEITDCLTMPLAGDARVAYCYVHPDKAKKFEKTVKKQLGNICEIYKGKYLIENNYYGLFAPNKKLYDRIGDYVLIMKENYVLRDYLPCEEKKRHIGNHSGLSEEEIYVPLILINC